MTKTQTRDLFGGAIKADLPAHLIDASDLRQVPDNQEVLLFSHSDVTCIVEVLEAVTEDDAGAAGLEAALRYHFSSLAHDNEATSSTVTSIQLPDPGVQQASGATAATPKPATLSGVQQVRKFTKPQSPLDTVVIYLALWRLAPARNVDLVMSWNEPVAKPDGDLTVAHSFTAAAQSLNIVDWGLFP